MAVLLSTSDLHKMGWTTALMKSLLGDPDEKEDFTRGLYHYTRHLYLQDRVERAMDSPGWKLACGSREARLARPALRMEAFSRQYPTWRAAVPDACKALHAANRYAKHGTCSESNKNEIYDLKNKFVQLLYEQGFCTSCWIHTLVLPAKVCRGCGGTGKHWEEECYRCDGTGEYLPEKRLKFYCFKISVGRTYTWHQPDNLVMFPVTTNAEPADWSGVERDKPLGMPRSALAAAKDLVRWVIDQAKHPETIVQFHETIPPIPETVEQMGLF